MKLVNINRNISLRISLAVRRLALNQVTEVRSLHPQPYDHKANVGNGAYLQNRRAWVRAPLWSLWKVGREVMRRLAKPQPTER